MLRKIQTALLSVSDKTGIVDFASFLAEQGVTLLSTGGTASLLRDNNIPVTDVSEVTKFPEIMDGRVKTLHPMVHGGILARRDDDNHVSAMKEHNIGGIDLVVVNLYPFEATVAKGASFEDCIENIDIGGPSMVRSAAKNHQDVVIVTEAAQYNAVIEEMKNNDGATTLELRRAYSAAAFARTAAYDAAISNWFGCQQGQKFPETITYPMFKEAELRYGENPHQQAALYLDGSNTPGVATAEQLQGKELSYNNISDTDAAFELVSEFDEPACAIIKHANPCGLALADSPAEAYTRALACDPTSAYGSIVAFNRPLDKACAEQFAKMFVEVIIAPEVDEEARQLLSKKKNLRVLVAGTMPKKDRRQMLVKTVAGGLLLQERDYESTQESDLKVVTDRAPTEQELKDLLFSFTVCKHVKSNAIVLAKDQSLTGVGAGQMSRIDSSRIAVWKAKETAQNVDDATGSVLASDAFLPFADGLIAAAEAGVTAIIQPGGSIRDQEVIDAANEHNIAMVFTGKRHFRH